RAQGGPSTSRRPRPCAPRAAAALALRHARPPPQRQDRPRAQLPSAPSRLPARWPDDRRAPQPLPQPHARAL
ncbi:MAG: hypothetical protein AVDCRST_MAG67-587, partial [uncultured Solirubrobacteraceae bacterium]